MARTTTMRMGIAGLEPATSMMFTNYDAAVAAAVTGQGIGLGRRLLIDALLKRRTLVAPLKDEIATARAYFLVVEPRAAKRPAVRALEGWLIEQARMSAPRRSLDMKAIASIASKTGH